MASALDNVVIVLDEPKDVVNVAGVVRVMKNMGLSRLRLVNPDDFDVRRITGIAHRTRDLVESAELFATLPEALADTVYAVGTSARARAAQRNYARPRQVAPTLVRRTGEGLVALVFGREDRGLTNAGLDLCDAIAIVPTVSEYSSLNLAQACLVLCYEVFLAAVDDAPLPTGKRDIGPAGHAELEQMYAALAGGLAEIDFFKGARSPEAVVRTLRTLISRAEPDLREVRLVRAIGFEMQNHAARAKAPPT